MTVLWIGAIVAAFIIGFFAGMWALVLRFKAELKNPGSPLTKELKEAVDHMDNDTTETCARGAEMYQDRCRCLNNCGVEIARMLRETQKGSQ